MPLTTLRPWITAGVALAGANVIVASPVLQTLPALPEVRTQAVQLTDIASEFTTNVADPFLYEPVPALQQVVVNEAGYLADIWDDVKNISSFETGLTSIVNDFGNVSAFETDFSNIVSDIASFNFSALSSVFGTVGTDFTNYLDQFSTTFSTIGTDFTNYFDQFPTTLSNIETDITHNATAALDAPISFFMPSSPPSEIITSLSESPFTIGFSVSASSVLGTVSLSPDITLGNHADLLLDLVNGLPINLSLGTILTVSLGTIHFGTIDILSLLLGSSTADQIKPLLEFSGSPLSGVLAGAASTLLSPIAGLTQDVINAFEALNPLTLASDFTTALTSATSDLTSVGTDFTNAFDALLSFDLTTAFNDLGNVGTDLTNAVDAFNPVISDLSSTIPTALSDLANIPGDMVNDFFSGFGNAATLLSDLGIPTFGLQAELGGLLSPGGSLFNMFGFDLSSSSSTTFLGITLSASGHISDAATEVGPLASLVEMGQAIANAIGWNLQPDQLGDLGSLF